ncbi:hypothetical protein [Nocardioides daphniae]|uniref:Adenylate kinase n=1 Tax=Nocardioides daphniae TaxID=402297 RepID=A0ABQ1Q9D4_9ACTN|nr:hypothetical protein [Nocardioides daphniae]GGD20028.1 adenylate kinase [Nocardioides daphniae]
MTTDDVRRMLDLVAAGPARLGTGEPRGRLLCVDGPAGSGKTTLARAVVAAAPEAHLLHLDLLLDGWDGLADVAATLVADVLEPLARGERAAYRRYDWHARRFAERVPVPATQLLVVEGVGAGSRATAPYRAASVWVEASTPLRRRRALARDGDDFAPHWDAWAEQEARLFTAERTRATADLRITTDL